MRNPYDTYLCRERQYFTVPIYFGDVRLDICKQAMLERKSFDQNSVQGKRWQLDSGFECVEVPVMLPKPKGWLGRAVDWALRVVR
jgi:hypothetical protein